MAFTDETNTEEKYGSLKTLTVLTFIGSILFGFLGGIWQFSQADKGVEALEKVANDPTMLEKIPDFLKKMYSPEAIEAARIAASNKLPILILTILGSALCILGAMQMRKLRQMGYYLWLIGEIFPVIGSILFLGKAAFVQGPLILGIAYGILLLFIILYTLQRKYLINK
jgi:hypothetical protein